MVTVLPAITVAWALEELDWSMSAEGRSYRRGSVACVFLRWIASALSCVMDNTWC